MLFAVVAVTAVTAVCDSAAAAAADDHVVVIEAVGILPRLFASVLIPPAVKKELSHGRAPVAVSTWIASPPAWLHHCGHQRPDCAGGRERCTTGTCG